MTHFIKRIALAVIGGCLIILISCTPDSWNEVPISSYMTLDQLLEPSLSDSSLSDPFYGMHYVPVEELAFVKDLGIEVVLKDFDHDAAPEVWLAYLDAAYENDLYVVAWLWPSGWIWDGAAWDIDAQAELFVKTVADHPALLAVYGLHEPYWMDCFGCGYTTAELQDLYQKIKAIEPVPIWSAMDEISFWAEYSEETAIADGVCDYCTIWYYPFLEGGVYERDELIEQLNADLVVMRDRAPNSKLIWTFQGFAQGDPYNLRMPTELEMRDIASIIYESDIDGALWYPWVFGDEYSDVLSNHPELFPVIKKIYEEEILGILPVSYLPIIKNLKNNALTENKRRCQSSRKPYK